MKHNGVTMAFIFHENELPSLISEVPGREGASDVAVTRIAEMHAAASRAGHAFVNVGVFRCWRSRDDGLHGVPVVGQRYKKA